MLWRNWSSPIKFMLISFGKDSEVALPLGRPIDYIVKIELFFG